MTDAAARPLGVTVETASVADVDDLTPLYKGFMKHEGVEPAGDAELCLRLLRLLASASDEVLIARASDSTPVGYLQQRYFLSVWRPGEDAYIEDVFVIEAERGRSVGEQLVGAAFERARNRGAKRICLDTNENNRRACLLYERLGFRNPNSAWNSGRQLYYSRLL